MSGISKKWMIGLGAVVVIAVAGVTVFLVTQPPAAQQQATGAIGTAERYRGEQIKEGDVGVTAPGTAAMAPVTDTELAEALGRASGEMRAMAFVRMPDADLGRVIGRTPVDLQARIFDAAAAQAKADAVGRLDEATAVRMLHRLDAATAERYASSLGMKVADFERMGDSERFATLAKASVDARNLVLAQALDAEKAQLLGRFEAGQVRSLAERMPAQVRAEIVQRTDSEMRAAVAARLTTAERNDLAERVISARELSGRLGNASGDLMLQLFDRADEATRSAIIGKMDTVAMLSVLERSKNPELQQKFLARTTEDERAKMLVAAAPDLLADLVGRVDWKVRVDAWGRLDDKSQQRMLASAKISSDAWGRMSSRERGEALARIDKAQRVELFGAFSPSERSLTFAAASLSERLDLAARSPDACARIYSRVDGESRAAFNALTNAAERQAAINRSDIFARAELTGVASRDELAGVRELEGRSRQPE